MKILFTLLLLTLSTAVLSQDDTTVTTQEVTETTPTTLSTDTPTTVVTTPTTLTTDAPTTTKEPVVTTTKEPVTTTKKPVVTTTKEPVTTTKEPVVTTTKEPVVTTTKEPVVTTTKEPVPEQPCTFNVTQSGVTCIRAELKAQFTIFYEDKKSVVYLGCNASYSRSDCSSNETQTLILEEPTHTLTMIFEKDGDKVFVRNVTFNYTLPTGESAFGESHDKLFSVKAGNSYLCRSETKVKLDNVTMEISDIHIQAFEEKGSENFGSAEECEADDKVSDIVPIAVGVALAALIIIVLIAYLVGRRRSRQKGYQSV